MADIARIEQQTKEFSDQRQRLTDLVQKLQDRIEAVKRELLPGIQTAAADVAAAQGALFETVKQSPSLFVKPKTMVIYGVRVGFKKEKGKVSISNEEITIRLIRKHLPDQAESLIQTTDKVLKNALQQLSGAELKKIGAEIQADTDQVFIKPVGDDIDKFVAALLEEGEAILKEAV